MLPWFMRNPAALSEVKAAVTIYPDLRVVEEVERVEVRGTFPVIHNGTVLDRFEVEIGFFDSYPDEMPLVREVGGRIPHTLERHVFPRSGIACVQVPEEWAINCGRSFRQFLDTPVRNYFLGQALVALGQPWPFGERGHGLEGLYQAYGDMIGETDPAVIVCTMDWLGRPEIKGHWRCLCGSGKRLRNCCEARFHKLRDKIPAAIAHSALRRMKDAARIAEISLPRLKLGQ